MPFFEKKFRVNNLREFLVNFRKMGRKSRKSLPAKVAKYGIKLCECSGISFEMPLKKFTLKLIDFQNHLECTHGRE